MEQVDVISRDEAEMLMPEAHYQTFSDMVKEFNTVFELTPPPELSIKLVEEEADELEEALSFVLKEACDLLYVTIGAQQHGVTLPEPLAAKVFHLSQYVGVFHPAIFHEAFTRVHESNMSKLDKDGLVVRREDGKALKSDLYKPADIRSLI